MEDKFNIEGQVTINDSDENIELNQDQKVWYVLSIISWTLFVCCQIESYINESSMFFNIYFYYIFYLPVTKIFILVISLAGLIFYLIFTTCKKDINLINGMVDRKSKFHFIPFLLISILFIIDQTIKNCFIGKVYYEDYYEDHYDHHYNYIRCSERAIKVLLIIDLAFSLLSFTLFIFSYIHMNLHCKWYIVLFIKKGAFSCLIPYILYKLFLDINLLILYEFKGINILRITIVISLCLIGLVSLGLSLKFKDILLAFINAIIYLGLIIKFSINNSGIKNDLGKILNIFVGIIISANFLLSFFVIVNLTKNHNYLIFK